MIFFKSVSSPAENIIRITPILAINPIPSRLEDESNKSFKGVYLARPINKPVKSIPTTWGAPIFLQPMQNSFDITRISANGNNTS